MRAYQACKSGKEKDEKVIGETMVSIIIPSYQRPLSVVKAVDSCLAQTYSDIEIIVVDDNDPETEYRKKTEEAMRRFADHPNVKYLKHEKNRKGSAARNTGIRAAQGEYITFLDDDDVMFPEKIEKQAECLRKLPEKYGVVCCAVEVRDEDTDKRMKTIQPVEREQVQFDVLRLRFGMGSGSNPMFRRSAVEQTGYFDEAFLRHQDTEYLIRVLRNYKMAVVNEVLLIKYQSDHPNRPNLKKYEAVHDLFLKTFEKDILKYTKEQQNEIYRNNWHQLCIVAVDARSWKEARKCWRTGHRYMRYTVKMYLGILRHVLNNRY